MTLLTGSARFQRATEAGNCKVLSILTHTKQTGQSNSYDKSNSAGFLTTQIEGKKGFIDCGDVEPLTSPDRPMANAFYHIQR